jgi:L-ascorbate metabolism protein UlaG (beta-lactamase superfamily)
MSPQSPRHPVVRSARALLPLSLSALSSVAAVLIVGALAMTASRVMSSPAAIPSNGVSAPAPEGTQPAVEQSPQWAKGQFFSERASPFSFMGPKRFHAPPIALDDLPEIEAVILSHDHYDHLDHDTVLALAPKVRHFVTPLGVGQRLIDWGVPAAKVQQFDWWQGTSIAGVQLTATPAQHFSGRSLSDRNSTLWASWVLIDDDLRVFFSGDTGYFDGFKAIGERFGPFDLTLMETGAYDPRWPYVHMQPEQTMQAHVDLKGKRLLPIHNGTFDLAMHRWQDPFERISALARLRNVELVTPVIGSPLAIEQPGPTPQWWQGAAVASPASTSAGRPAAASSAASAATP